MGAFVISPLPRLSGEESQNSRAPSLRGHCPGSTLLRTLPTPSRLRLTSRVRRLYERVASVDSSTGRVGALQLLRRVLVLVPPLPPRRNETARQPTCAVPCCRAKPRLSASGVPQ